MTLPALVLVLAAAAPQKGNVVSVETSPLGADAHLRESGEPSSFLERSELYSGVEAACTLHPRYRSVELVAAVEEDLCASIPKAPECNAIAACAWMPVRKRSFLEHAARLPSSTLAMSMTKRCQAKNPLTVDLLTSAGVADVAEAESICAGLEVDSSKDRTLEDRCRRNFLCRYGCFPPECGCYLNDRGYNQQTPPEVCTANMNSEDMCNRNQACTYRNSGLLFGFPMVWVVVGGSVALLCVGGWCFMCVAVWQCCTPRKKHHHHHHDHHAHEEHAEHEEEWEEH